MKCPKCWAEKAYVREVRGWKGALMACALLVPMKCNHCYHKFVLPWFLTLGRAIRPPKPGPNRSRWSDRPAHAASPHMHRSHRTRAAKQ
jgi:hypothetical protein